MFYELFIYDIDGTRHDVPVVIANFRDDLGNFPNKDESISTSFRYVRRFFLIDVVSGIKLPKEYKANDPPKVCFFTNEL
jgi:hypothetical protein